MQEIIQNLTSNDQAKCSTLTKCMDDIRRSMFLIWLSSVDNHATSRDWFLRLWKTKFRDSDRGGNGHDWRRDQSRGWYTKIDVCYENWTRDRWESLWTSALPLERESRISNRMSWSSEFQKVSWCRRKAWQDRHFHPDQWKGCRRRQRLLHQRCSWFWRRTMHWG